MIALIVALSSVVLPLIHLGLSRRLRTRISMAAAIRICSDFH
jgi:hypothetical protein